MIREIFEMGNLYATCFNAVSFIICKVSVVTFSFLHS